MPTRPKPIRRVLAHFPPCRACARMIEYNNGGGFSLSQMSRRMSGTPACDRWAIRIRRAFLWRLSDADKA